MLGAMALFALLLIGLLVVAFFRFQEPPRGPGGPAVSPQSSVVRLQSSGINDRRLTTVCSHA